MSAKERNVTLIGMSNAGKSFWATRMRDVGYKMICCDDLIEARLGPFLETQGFRGITDVARWMGQPYEPQSAENQARYLLREMAVMEEIIGQLPGDRQTVIDTTGSVIYTGDPILKRLSELTTIVLLDTPDGLLPDLYQKYLAEPKPVIWGDLFRPLPGEQPQESLGRCYPELLRYRNALYRKWAHKTVCSVKARREGFGVHDLLKEISV